MNNSGTDRRLDLATAADVDRVLLAQSDQNNQAARTLAAQLGLNTLLLIRILHHRTAIRQLTAPRF